MRKLEYHKSHRTGVSTFASPTSPSTAQSLQKSFHLSNPKKIELKKISSPSENKKYTNAQTNTTNKKGQINSTMTMVYRHGGQERQHTTAVWRNGGCSASYDSFVIGSSVVLRLNFCAKNPPLRQAAKRYQQP